MRNWILLLLIVVGVSAKAQNGADAVLPDTTKPLYNKVMVIPFEKSMYLVQVQTYLAQKSGKTHNEIVEFFRESVALEMQNQFLYKYNTVSLYHNNDTAKDLFKAYDAVRYKFEVAPVEEPDGEEEESENSIDKARNLFKRKPQTEKEYERGTTSKGQIVSTKNTAQKFANVVVTKPELLQKLHKKYNTDLFVYVTEFDIENDISDQTAFINGDYKRLLRLHYSMVDKDGKIVEKGLVTIPFPNNENDIYRIRTLYLPLAAKKLSEKLPFRAIPVVDPIKGKAVDAGSKVSK